MAETMADRAAELLELRRQVATALGWTNIRINDRGGWYGCTPDDTTCRTRMLDPLNDPVATAEVKAWILSKGGSMVMVLLTGGSCMCYCWPKLPGIGTPLIASGDTEGEAICRAALAVVEWEVTHAPTP